MEKEFIIIQMEANMMENGWMISKMDKEYIHGNRIQLEIGTKEIT